MGQIDIIQLDVVGSQRLVDARVIVRQSGHLGTTRCGFFSGTTTCSRFRKMAKLELRGVPSIHSLHPLRRQSLHRPVDGEWKTEEGRWKADLLPEP